MIEEPSNQETHSRYCATKNTRSALILIAVCLLMVYLDWRNLRKPFPKITNYDLFWNVIAAAASVQLLRIFSCLRERFVIAVAILIAVREVALRLFPALLGPMSVSIRQAFLVLWVFALLASMSAFVSTISGVEPA